MRTREEIEKEIREFKAVIAALGTCPAAQYEAVKSGLDELQEELKQLGGVIQ